MEDSDLTADSERITLSHGSGGRAMKDLIREVFLAEYGAGDGPGDDSAVLSLPAGEVAFTTDSFVVDPIFFPGGDIGEARGGRNRKRSTDRRGKTCRVVGLVHNRGRPGGWRRSGPLPLRCVGPPGRRESA